AGAAQATTLIVLPGTTLNLNTYALTIAGTGNTATPLLLGTMNGGTGSIIFTAVNSAGDITIPAGSSYPNLTLSGTETYRPSANLTVNGNLTVAPGSTLNTFDGTVERTLAVGGATTTVGGTLLAGTNAPTTLTFEGLTVGGTLNLAAGGYAVDVTVKQDLDTSVGFLTTAAGTFTFSGSVAQSLLLGTNATFFNVVIDNAGGNVSMSGSGVLRVNGALTIANNQLMLSGGGADVQGLITLGDGSGGPSTARLRSGGSGIYAAGGFVVNPIDGSYNHSGNTVRLDGSGPWSGAPTTDFGSVIINGPGITVTAGSNLLTDTLSITDGTLDLGTYGLDANGTISIGDGSGGAGSAVLQNGTGGILAGGGFTVSGTDGNYVPNGGTLKLDGNGSWSGSTEDFGTVTVDGAGIFVTAGSNLRTGSLTVGGGTLTLGGNQLDADGLIAIGDGLGASKSAKLTNGSAGILAGAGVIENPLDGDYIPGGATFTFDGSGTWTSGGDNFGDVVVTGASTVVVLADDAVLDSLTVTGSATLDADTNDADIAASLDVSFAGGTFLSGDSTETLSLIGASQTLDPGTNALRNLVTNGTARIDNNSLVVNGTTSVGALSTLEIRNTLPSATFNGPVSVAGTLDLNADTTFNKSLTVDGVLRALGDAITLRFDETSLTDINGTILIDGAGSNRITLASTTDGDAWDIDLAGATQTFADVNVRDSSATATLTATGTSLDLGNNADSSGLSSDYVWTGGGDGADWSDGANWEFGFAPVSNSRAIFDGNTPAPTLNSPTTLAGIEVQSTYSQASPITLTQNLTLTSDLLLDVASATSLALGTSTLTVQGNATLGRDITGSSGSTLRFTQPGAATLTLTGGLVNTRLDVGSGGSNTTLLLANASPLTVEALFIDGGSILDTGAADAAVMITNEATIAGSLTVDASLVTVGGNWDSSGAGVVSFSGAGTLLFDGTAAQTVTVGAGDVFQNVVIDSAVTLDLASALWDINGSLTIGDGIGTPAVFQNGGAGLTVSGGLLVDTDGDYVSAGATLTLDGTGTWSGAGENFSVVVIDGTITAASNLLTDDLTIAGGTLSLGTNQLDADGIITIGDGLAGAATLENGAGGILAAAGFVVNVDGDYTHNTGTLTFDGAGTWSGTGENFGVVVIDGTVTAASDLLTDDLAINGGTLTLGTNQLDADGIITIGDGLAGTATLENGTGGVLAGAGLVVNTDGDYVPNAGTLTFDGPGICSSADALGDVVVTGAVTTLTLLADVTVTSLTVTGSATLDADTNDADITASGIVSFAGGTFLCGDSTETLTLTGASQTLDPGTNALRNLAVPGTVTVQNNPLVINGSTTVDGTLDLNADATFNGPLTVNGTLQAVGDAITIRFDETAPTDINGTILIDGAGANRITLASTTDGNAWDVDLVGATQTFADVNVRDSNSTTPLTATGTSLDLGNNAASSGLSNDYVWVGGSVPGDWSAGANWALGFAPVSNSRAIFDATGAANPAPTLNSPTALGGIEVTSTYSQATDIVLTQDLTLLNDLVLDASSATSLQLGGTTLTIQNNATLGRTVTGAAGSALRFTKNGAASLTLAGSPINTKLQVGSGSSATLLQLPGPTPLDADALTISAGATFDAGAFGALIDVNGALVIDGTYVEGTGDTRVSGDVTLGGSAVWTDNPSGALIFDGTGAQTWDGGGVNAGNVEIDNGSTVQLANSDAQASALDVTAGDTLDLNNRTLTATGALTVTGVLTDAGAAGPGNAIVTNAFTLTGAYVQGARNTRVSGNLTISPTATWSSDALGKLVFDGGVLQTWDGGGIDVGHVQIDNGSTVQLANSGAQVATLDVTAGDTFDLNGQTLTVNGTGSTDTPLVVAGTYTGTGTTVIASTNSTGDVFVPAAGATFEHLQLTGAENYRLAGNRSVNGNLRVGAGATLKTSSGSVEYLLSVAGATLIDGTIAAGTTGATTLTFSGAVDLNGTLSLNNGNAVDVNVAGDFDATGGALAATAGAFTLDGGVAQTLTLDGGETFYDLAVTNAAGVSLAGAGILDVDRDLVVSGALNVGNRAVNVSRNLNGTGGTLTWGGSGTLLLDGIGQMIIVDTGSSDFDAITVSQSAAANVVTIVENGTQTLTATTVTVNTGILDLQTNSIFSGGSATVIGASGTIRNSSADGRTHQFLSNDGVNSIVVDGTFSLTADGLDIVFAEARTVDVNGTGVFDVGGTAGVPNTIRDETDNATQWTLDVAPTATASIYWATLQDANAAGSTPTVTNTTNGGDSTGWTYASADISVTPTSGLVTDEFNATDTFTVVLTAAPAADVTVAISSSDTTEGLVSPPSLLFTSANWSIPQTVTVTGVDDVLGDGDVAYTIITAPAVSSDPIFDGINPSDVTATNMNNDVPGTLQLSAASYTAGETGGVVTVTVTRLAGTLGAVGASYATSDGTAAAGSDYTATAGTVAFADGDTADKTFTIPILADALTEGSETLTVTLSAPTGGASLGAPTSATVTLTDSPGQVQFSAPTYRVSENGTSVDITITRAAGNSGVVSVDLASSDCTATQPADYASIATTVTFADGDSADKTVTLWVFDDLIDEGDETVNLTLTNPTGGAALGGPSAAVGTIIDHETSPGRLQFSDATYAVAENQAGVLVTVLRSEGAFGVVTADVATTTGGSALAGADYTATTSTLTFADGVISQTLFIPLLDDASVEGDESISVSLGNVTGGATTGWLDRVTVNVIDHEVGQAGTIQFSTSAYQVTEDGKVAVVTVSRSGGSAGVVTVDCTTSDGTAMAGADYVASSGTPALADGQLTATFLVPILDDGLVEGDETVNLALSNVTGGATLGMITSAVLTIMDHEAGQPGDLQWSASNYPWTESGGLLELVVRRTGGVAGTVTVDAGTADLTAVAPGDYVAVSTTLTFGDRETQKAILLSVLDDAAVEGDETLNLVLSNATGGAAIVGPNPAVIVILNDDVPSGGGHGGGRCGLLGLEAILALALLAWRRRR
ncbi:MAG: hypothetical protein HYY16_16005, partial [Planctomycetes bacterium]|nr:hypothetical protein [Planctomycetota bacterium]